jgi:hypothetical protein
MIKTLLKASTLSTNPRCKLSDKSYNRVIKVITWILSIPDPKHYWVMKDRIVELKQRSGPTFVVQYLKEAMRCTQKFIAGQPCTTSEGVSVSLVKGLPRLIPGPLRNKIRSGDLVTTRATLSVLSLFRVIDCKPKLKINTITDPFTGVSKVLNPLKVKSIISLLPKKERGYCRSIVSVSAGPNAKKAFMSLPYDAYALSGKSRILLAFKTLSMAFGGEKIYDSLMNEISFVTSSRLCEIDVKLGKLSFLREPAGKVRVVAILDGWSQMLLSGLHSETQSILKKIPQDGTMDQGRPISLLRMKDLKDKPVYSFDLSSATDRLPIDLQCQILSFIYNKDIAWAWREVMVGRDFHAFDQQLGVDTTLRYTVGQPMGALSSFNMLALSHHIIVQVAALNCGYSEWFCDYALLGDDIVIADKVVAMAYKSLMMDLGLELSDSKGFESPNGTFEFCKRMITPSGEVSPIGMKGLSVALKSPAYLTSLFVDLSEKGVDWSSDVLVHLFTNPPTFIIKSRKIRDRVLWTLLGLFGFVPSGGMIGPGKTLDSSIRPLWMENILDTVDLTSQILADKDRKDSLEKTTNFVEELDLVYSKGLVRGFTRSYTLSLFPSFWNGVIVSLAERFYGQIIWSGIPWLEFPSYSLIYEKVMEEFKRATEQSNLSSALVNESIIGYNGSMDQTDIEPSPEDPSLDEFVESLKAYSASWFDSTVSSQDFMKDPKPPVLLVGERVMRFWKQFDQTAVAFNFASYFPFKRNEIGWTKRPKRRAVRGRGRGGKK